MCFQSKQTAKEIVRESLKENRRLAGLGHKIYKTTDPRSEALFKYALKLRMGGKFIKKARDVQEEFKKASGKVLALNIDMAMAACMSELGFDYKLGKAIFSLGRLPGMIAHVYEEATEEKPYRRLEESDVVYKGPAV